MFVVFPKDTFYDVPLAPLKNSVKSQINNIHPWYEKTNPRKEICVFWLTLFLKIPKMTV